MTDNNARRAALDGYAAQVEAIRDAGTYKNERVLSGPQGSRIDTTAVDGVLNFCANNYLGLANHPDLVAAAHAALDRWGYGLSSVRFICGTQEIHRALEDRLSAFLGVDDTILYSSCYDANGGLFETLLGEGDAVISDELNHASIIDGIRLCKARRWRYRNNDLADLERCLAEARAAGSGRILIATDGVFSMDGIITDLRGICDLADRYGALTFVDDSHAVGFVGEHGRGTPEHCGVEGRIDILTGTLGKALGGASGGYTAARREIVALLRQRSRPYLFSNTLAPVIAATSLAALGLIERDDRLRGKLTGLTRLFREGLRAAGLDIVPGEHPIVPVMLYDAAKAGRIADRLLQDGIYVIAFSYPVVPQGKARIRTQVSAAHTEVDLKKAIQAIAETVRNDG